MRQNKLGWAVILTAEKKGGGLKISKLLLCRRLLVVRVPHLHEILNFAYANAITRKTNRMQFRGSNIRTTV
jgi:hypothetical protein